MDIPATSAEVLVGLNRKTTQCIYSLLRAQIVEFAIQEARPFGGYIEVDDSCFGAKRIRGKRERGAGGKAPVLGLHKRQGRFFVSVVQNCSKAELMPILQGRIVVGSYVYTDGWKSYDGPVTNGAIGTIEFTIMKMNSPVEKTMAMALNPSGLLRSFEWQNFAGSGRENS